MPKLLVADDHPLIRDSMVSLLAGLPQGNPCVIEQVENADALWEICDRHCFDLVLLDLHMPGMAMRGGLEAYLNIWLPKQPTALFSGNITEKIQRDFRNAGGRGILHKTIAGPSMLAAVQLMLTGEHYFPTRLHSTSPVCPDTSALTQRQQEIYGLLLRGFSNKAIAQELGLTLGTVKNHVHDVYQKLNVSNRYEALTNGLGDKLNNS